MLQETTAARIAFPPMTDFASPVKSDETAGGFDAVMSNVVSDALSQLRNGETAALSSMTGAASIQQTVSSVMNAERTLQAMVALRDRAVSAYQDIVRMSI